MPAEPRRLWPVTFDPTAWEIDLHAATPVARAHAERWRTEIERAGGIPHDQRLPTRADDDGGMDLPNCAKTRLPYPDDHDPDISPWGAVLRAGVRASGPYLSFLAFGLRHPDPAGPTPSVYQRAHRRLMTPPAP